MTRRRSARNRIGIEYLAWQDKRIVEDLQFEKPIEHFADERGVDYLITRHRAIFKTNHLDDNGVPFTTDRHDIVEVRRPLGPRPSFGGKRVSRSLFVHMLKTGEVLKRVPREKKDRTKSATKRYKAQIRHDGAVVYIGSYASQDEARAAEDAYRAANGMSPRQKRLKHSGDVCLVESVSGVPDAVEQAQNAFKEELEGSDE